MRNPSRLTWSVLFVAFVVVCRLVRSAGAEPAAPPPPPSEPSTYLCDSPDAPAAAKADAWLAPMKGWSRLEEDDKTHAFRGQPVFMNDKVVAVLEPGSPSVSVY